MPSVFGPTRGAAPTPRRARVLTLRQCLRMAELNYPKVHEARAKLAQKRAELFEAHTAPFSDFKVVSGVGIAPTIRGTSVYSPNSDTTLNTSMALAWQVGVEGLVPLWTFGKIDNLWDAAEANVKVGEHEVKKEKNALKLRVREAYYGLQLARDSLALLREAMKRIDKYLVHLEKKVREGDGDDIELLKVKMNRAELDGRFSEALKAESVAMSGLKFLVGAKGAIDIPDLPLARTRHRLAPLAHYLSAARLFRPEVNMARAGVLARRAQLRIQDAGYYPDVGLALSAKWMRAEEITDQRNPFAHDAANGASYGFALAMRWDLDFLPQSARVAKARADLEAMRATERYALGGVGVEVEKAFAEAEDAERRLEAYSRAAKYAKQWLIKVQQGIEIGTFDDEDIVDPAKEWALKRFSEMNATFDYNMAVAKLALATGWDAMNRGD